MAFDLTECVECAEEFDEFEMYWDEKRGRYICDDCKRRAALARERGDAEGSGRS
jgi:recombinational DNA repair protein (RecF pathway)